MKKRKLSKKDWEIIKLLKKDARMSDAEIGRRIGLSKSAVRWRRINLQKRGYLLISAYLRFDKLGYTYAFVLVKIKPDTPRNEILKFKKALMENEHTFEIYEVLGDYNVLIGVFGEDVSELKRNIQELIIGQKCVQEYKVLLGAKSLKGLEVPFWDALED
ncbi:Lrp/AsnC family transcriptional regulator [Pyrococcus horikoshii]|uniref:Uncharacterized HTH-type transcriptional regulator PH1055 n=2 Tax=Pyrococcus horikoshii TaxID=53953 RepID=REG5_PYRHO|nr:Lrp/AsnC family transcriptional regulator [Pyrococcus horikoshii]O58782.2 RecName: Full=Uncharacterized HTH-type transcriptional regulator PH1055 [Pyrococcus horikoshii OT3]HII61895.1 Lrp/AsnC family transcriptional regulator [Pyrococcus horikoshii]